MSKGTWFKMFDGFDDHPKVVGLSDAAYRLAVAGMAYSSRQLTDGVVPAAAARRLVPHADPQELVDAGLWELDMSRCDSYVIHAYLEYNRSREQVEKDRTSAAERKRASRERQKQAKAAKRSHRDRPVTHAVSHGPVTPQETETETETYNPPPTPSCETDRAQADLRTKGAFTRPSLSSIDGLRRLIDVPEQPLFDAIQKRAVELDMGAQDVADALVANLRSNPLPSDIAKPWGFLTFRLAQIQPPPPATVPSSDSQVLAALDQPKDQPEHQPEGTNPMDPTTARQAARAALQSAAP